MAERPPEPGPGYQAHPGWSDAPAQPSFQPAYQPAYRPAYQPAYQPEYPVWPAAPADAARPAWPVPTLRAGVQRPAVIGIAASMAITASLEFLVLLGFALLVAASVMSTFSTSEQPEAAIYHVAERFQLYLEEGLALPLVGFPLASTVAGFLLIARRRWARIAHTVVGVAAVGWSGWWLRDHLGFWVPTTLYIAIAVLILWLPAVGRWYAARPTPTGATPPDRPVRVPDPGRQVEHLRS